MTWQYNPNRDDVTDPAVPKDQSRFKDEAYAYYGGDLICQSVRPMHGPLLAEAQNMLALLKKYVAEDPCAPGDPRYTEALAIIERIEPKPKEPVPRKCMDCGVELPVGQVICNSCIPF